MKESAKLRAAGVGYAALVVSILGLFMVDKKAQVNLYMAASDVYDAQQIQKSINDSIVLAFETKTGSDGQLLITNNPAARASFNVCMAAKCDAPEVHADIIDGDSWPTIARKAILKELNSWNIRDDAEVFHACTVKQMNCVQDNVMTK